MCAVLAVIVVAACGGRKSDGDDRPPPATRDAAPTSSKAPSKTLDDPNVVLPREMSFTLLEPGDGAREQLRYRLDGGAEQRELVSRSTMKLRSNADGVWGDEITMAPVRYGFGVSASAGVVHLRGLEAHVSDGTP